MKRFVVCTAALAVAALTCMGPDTAFSTGSRIHGPQTAPSVTLLSRSYRWVWDPFRVDGHLAYAHVFITNYHEYALTLKTYCKANGKLLRPLTQRYLIKPGDTLEWDTRKIEREMGKPLKALVTCKFWVDGQVNMKGEIVNRVPVRMGKNLVGATLLTFNMPHYPPKPKS